MKTSSRILTESIIAETIKRELGINPHEDIDGFGRKGKNRVYYSRRENTERWYVCLEFLGEKGDIELTKYLKTEQELIELIKYFKKLKKVR